MPTRSRRWLCLLAFALTLTTACRPYRLPSPQAPPQPKATTNTGDNGGAAPVTALKGQRNSYDKNGLLKKKKYERRRLKHKSGQRMIFGRPLPFE
jgi:hypothetical protein